MNLELELLFKTADKAKLTQKIIDNTFKMFGVDSNGNSLISEQTEKSQTIIGHYNKCL